VEHTTVEWGETSQCCFDVAYSTQLTTVLGERAPLRSTLKYCSLYSDRSGPDPFHAELVARMGRRPLADCLLSRGRNSRHRPSSCRSYRGGRSGQSEEPEAYGDVLGDGRARMKPRSSMYAGGYGSSIRAVNRYRRARSLPGAIKWPAIFGAHDSAIC
jgi:hypothetical protein